MPKTSKTILLFTEQRDAINYLSDEQAGQIFKALYAYTDEGLQPDFDGAMMSVFAMLRSQIDRSQEAYRVKCEKNRSNSMRRKIMQDKTLAQTEENDCLQSLTNDNGRCPSAATVILPNPNPNSNPNIDDGTNASIINEAEVRGDEEFPFYEIWEMYDKPVGVQKRLRQRWKALLYNDKKAIFAYVPLYVKARPDRKYRKDLFGIPDAIWEWEVGWSLASGSLLLPISKMCQQTFCILASQQS